MLVGLAVMRPYVHTRLTSIESQGRVIENVRGVSWIADNGQEIRLTVDDK